MLAEIFGPDLLIVVIVIAVLIFGGAAIPKLARSLGSAQGEFKKGVTDAKTAADADTSTGDAKATEATTNGSNPASAPAKAEGTDSGSSS
jgi:sec-independent protein translocase protein TatA